MQCYRCKEGNLCPVISPDRTSYEADLCDKCGATWTHNPPRPAPSLLPNDAVIMNADWTIPKPAVISEIATPPGLVAGLDEAARRSREEVGATTTEPSSVCKHLAPASICPDCIRAAVGRVEEPDDDAEPASRAVAPGSTREPEGSLRTIPNDRPSKERLPLDEELYTRGVDWMSTFPRSGPPSHEAWRLSSALIRHAHERIGQRLLERPSQDPPHLDARQIPIVVDPAMGTGEWKLVPGVAPCACGAADCNGPTDNERHQCGGPREACGAPGCKECGAEPRNRLNRGAYEGLIAEDLAWLEAQPRTLERDHVLAIVRASVGREYPAVSGDAATLIREARERAEMASAGPWWINENGGVTGGDPEGSPHDWTDIGEADWQVPDLLFAVTARSDVPALCDLAERLTRERDEALAEMTRWRAEAVRRTNNHEAALRLFRGMRAERDGAEGRAASQEAWLRESIAILDEKGREMKTERDEALATVKRMKPVVEAALSEFDAFTLMNDRIARAVKAYRGGAS